MFQRLISVLLLCLFFIFHSNCQFTLINRIDFVFEQFHTHKTAQFYNDFRGVSNVIVRRGDDFKFAVELAGAYNKENIDVQLLFESRLDKLEIILPQDTQTGWSLQQSSSQRRVNAVIHIPGNAPVGIWKMQILLKNSYGSLVERYEVPHKIVILFNPWSREDATYFPEEHKLSEYIMNENGIIFAYDWTAWKQKPWIFGQSDVLDAVLFVINRADLDSKLRGDPVRMARELTYLLNDDGQLNRGVLSGKWSEPFTSIEGRPATRPSEWIGSAPIFKQYYWSRGQTVGYGQCWVYSGLLTTALRALGIPARPVSTFASAHDKGNDLTVDTKLNAEGFILKKESDLIWNFHVWVQAWFMRHDLGLKTGGWQELDATPQAENDGRFQVGPASTVHVRNTQLSAPYESAYIYSEVNADEVLWSAEGKIVGIHRDKIGLAVMTKKVGAQSHDEITYMYKPKENTPEERKSYKAAAAAMGITPVSLRSNIAARAAKHTVSMAINSSSNVVVGSPIAVQLLIRNPIPSAKSVKFAIRASSMYYNGEQGDVIKLERLVFVMKGRETKKLTFIIYADEYIGKLKDFNTIYIEAVARCEKGLDRVVDRLSLYTPQLKITAPQSVKVNESFSVKVQFRNPLNKILKNCVFVVEGTRLERRKFPVGDIAAKAIGGTILKLRSSNPYLETIVIYFHANNLREVTGVFQLQVVGKRKHYFAMYSQKRTPQNRPQTQNGVKGNPSLVVSPDRFRCCDLVNF